MGNPQSRASQASFYTACSCAAVIVYEFGFDASVVRFVNLSGKTVYAHFGSSAASTGDARLSTGESYAGLVPLTRIMSFVTTGTCGAEVSAFALG